MNRTEAMAIAELLNYTRGLTKWYISKVPQEKLNETLEINGHQMNSAYWLIAHLTWAEYSISRSLGAPKLGVGWLDEFKISSPHTPHQDEWPVYADLHQAMDEVHESTVEFTQSLSYETLNEVHPNEQLHHIFKTKRQALFHINRHEGYHTGQIGLIAKAYGAKTV